LNHLVESILNLLYNNNTKLVLCGYINVNYLIDNKKKQVDVLLSSYNLSSTVNFPTRVQNGSVTAIDNIFIDISIHDSYSIFPLCNGLSDHEAQLIVLGDVKVNGRNVSSKRRIRKIDEAAVQDS
jgi:hypothetical protein